MSLENGAYLSDAVVKIGKANGDKKRKIILTKEQVRDYPEMGISVLNEWGDLKTATTPLTLPFYSSHGDHELWGEAVGVKPCDDHRLWTADDISFNESAPPEFVDLVDSGVPLPVSLEYLAKLEAADGYFGGKMYNRKASGHVFTGLAYAKEGEWGARCEECKINPPETDITITHLSDAVLLDLMKDRREGDNNMTKKETETPEAGGSQNVSENPAVETKAAAGASGEASSKTEAPKVEAKVEEKKEKAPEAKTDVQHQEAKKEGEGEEVTETKESLLSKILGSPQAVAELAAAIAKAMPAPAKPMADAAELDAMKADVTKLLDAKKAQEDAAKIAFADAQKTEFRSLLNEAGKAKMDSEPEFYTSFRDAEAKGTSLLWQRDHRELFDAGLESGAPLGVMRQGFSQEDESKRVNRDTIKIRQTYGVPFVTPEEAAQGLRVAPDMADQSVRRI